MTAAWTLDSRWFDLAVFSTLSAVLTVAFGCLEEHEPSRAGINGVTGEPRDRFEALRRQSIEQGEARMLWNLAKPRRRSSP